ncbi:MAG: hypothetical protein CMF50_03225 [Legionellales bacterium]|nr:hypothetical protein [Legionellales bacterium]|tara:strand:- start:15546 stop:15890 length:345 start_codon:yes stop_codon:yes gene_type:complete
MFEVDRIVAIIKPRQALFEWLQGQKEVSIDNLTLKNLQRDCTALLIPQFDGPNQAKEYIRQIYDGILEGELASWGVPKRLWPKERTIELFNEWFLVEFHSMVFDLAYLEQKRQA